MGSFSVWPTRFTITILSLEDNYKHYLVHFFYFCREYNENCKNPVYYICHIYLSEVWYHLKLKPDNSCLPNEIR